MAQSKRIYSVQGLRTIAALFVLTHHITGMTGLANKVGDAEVCMMLMVSGFLLSNHKVADSWRFFFDKFARLWPLSTVCLVFVALLFHGDFMARLPQYVLDFFMLQSWVPDAAYYYSGDPVAWFLSTILFCYAMFPLLKRALDRNLRLSAYVFGAACGALVLCGIASGATDDTLQSFIYVAPYSRVLDFFCGMLLRRVVQRGSFNANALQLSAVVVLGLFLLTSPSLPTALSLTVWWFVPVGLLIASVSQGDGRAGFLGAFLSCRPMVWLGNISFGIFMWHFPAMWTADIVLTKLGIEVPLWFFVPAIGALTIVAAYFSNRYIETPATKLLRTFILRSE